jgi:hypothetical protein
MANGAVLARLSKRRPVTLELYRGATLVFFEVDIVNFTDYCHPGIGPADIQGLLDSIKGGPVAPVSGDDEALTNEGGEHDDKIDARSC